MCSMQELQSYISTPFDVFNIFKASCLTTQAIVLNGYGMVSRRIQFCRMLLVHNAYVIYA